MIKKLSTLIFLFIFSSALLAETPEKSIDFLMTDGSSATADMSVGFDPTATDGLDTHLGEAELPPAPPAGVFDARFTFPNSVIGSLKDYREGSSDITVTAEHTLKWQLGTGSNFTFSWDLPEGVSMTVQDAFGGILVNEQYGSGPNSLTVENTSLTSLNISVEYTAGTVLEPPAAPSNLTAEALMYGEISLNWIDNANNEDGFKVERKTEPGGSFEYIGLAGAGVNHYEDQTVEDGITYTYRIYAWNDAGNSGYSNEASATALVAQTPPEAPSDLTAEALVVGEIALNWTDNSEFEDGFKIERKTEPGGSFAYLAEVGQSIVTYTDETVDEGVTYTYRVYGYNNAGNSGYSNEASATALTSPQLPDAPSDLTAQALVVGKIELNWTDNSDNEDGFKIERKSGTGSFALIDDVTAGVTTYTDMTVTAGETYTYRVYAYNTAGNSGFSNEASATALTPTIGDPVTINMTAEDNVGGLYNMVLGIHPQATNGIDTQIGESELPPPPPAGVFDSRFIFPDGTTASLIDYRLGDNSYASTHDHKLQWQLGTGSPSFEISWVMPSNCEMTIQDPFGGALINEFYNTPGPQTLTVTNSSLITLNITVHYIAGGGPTVPADPSNLTAQELVAGEIELNWQDNANNEDGFVIEREEVGVGSYTELITLGADVTTYTDMSVTPSTEYNYRVKAYNATGSSGWSNVANITTMGTQPGNPVSIPLTAKDGVGGTYSMTFGIDPAGTDGLDTQLGESELPPPPPAGVFDSRFIFPNGTTASLLDYREGDDQTIITHSYKLQWQLGTGSSELTLDWNQPLNTTVTITDPLGGVLVNEVFYPGMNNYVITNTSLTSVNIQVEFGPTAPMLEAPTNLVATNIAIGSVELTWTDNSTEETGFSIERMGPGGTWDIIGTVGVDVEVYPDETVQPNTEYKYRVQAYNATMESPYSNVATITTWGPQPPYFTSTLPDTTISEGEILQWQYEAEDPNNDPLVFYKHYGPTAATVTGDGLLTWQPSFQVAGNYTIIVAVTDQSSRFVTLDTAYVEVLDVNQTPVFTTVMPDTTIDEGQLLEFQWEGEDPDNNPLTFAIFNGPANAQITTDGLFSWTPDASQSGPHEITVSLSDNVTRAVVYHTTTVNVTDVNHAPYFTQSISELTIPANEFFEFEYIAEDPDNDPIIWGSQNLPDGASFNGGMFSWTPTADQIGPHTFTITISDGQLGDEVTSALNVVIPIGISAGQVTATPGSEVVVPFDVMNFDNIGAITLKIDFDPVVMTFLQPENINPEVATAIFNINDDQNSVLVSWFDNIPPFDGANIGTGHIFDIKFQFHGGETPLTFDIPQCEISDINGNPMSVFYENGYVKIAPITVLQPNGGEEWTAGDIETIQWVVADFVDELNIEYSHDNGATWQLIAGNYPVTNGQYDWTIPATPTMDALVKLTYSSDGSVFDISDDVFTIMPSTFTISGAVMYDNAGTTPFHTGQIDVVAAGGGVVTTVPIQQDGSYIAEVENGAYTLVPSTTIEFGGVNTTDALLVQRHTVGLITLAPFRELAGDVNFSMTTNTTDALLIQRRTVGLIQSFQRGDWTFENPEVTIAGMNEVQDILGLTTGDVNASHNINPALAKEAKTLVSMKTSDVMSVKQGEEIAVPVLVNSASEINAMTLELDYPVDLVEFTGIEFAGNNLMYNDVDGKILISWADVTSFSVPENGQLLTVNFKPTEDFKIGTSFNLDLGNLTEIANSEAMPMDLGLSSFTVEVYKPTDFTLRQNYPNPFNPTTIIEYELPENSEVTIEIYNVVGQKVTTLVNEKQDVGVYKVKWAASDFASGMYIYRIVAKSDSKTFSQTHKMMLLK